MDGVGTKKSCEARPLHHTLLGQWTDGMSAMVSARAIKKPPTTWTAFSAMFHVLLQGEVPRYRLR